VTRKTQLYKKMSVAREVLSRALLECHRIHAVTMAPYSHMPRPQNATGCVCDACKIRVFVEEALGELEV
jgi:hypothetical protein